MPLSPKVAAKRSHSSVGGAPGLRHGDDMDALGRDLRAPPVQDVGQFLDAPEPGGRTGPAARISNRAQEPAVAERPPVLDVLLPLRRNLADQIAGADHQVDLGVRMAEVLERLLSLRPRREASTS